MTLYIPDLNENEREQLAQALPPDSLCFEEVGASSEPHGREMGTLIAAVIVSLAALRVLAVWIARHVEKEETEINVQTHQPDGSVKTLTFRSRKSSSQSEAEVLKQLAAACKVDLPTDLGS